MKAILSYCLVLMLTMLIAIGYAYLFEKEKQKADRLEQNFTAVNKKLEYITTKSGLKAAKNEVVQYTKSELPIAEPRVVNHLQDISVKSKRVSSVSTTGIESSYVISTKLSDSISKTLDTLTTFNFTNKWINVSGTMNADSANIQFYSIDTLIQVVFRGKRKNPYLWIFSPRKLEQIITSKNPNTTIVYNRTIHIVKN